MKTITKRAALALILTALINTSCGTTSATSATTPTHGSVKPYPLKTCLVTDNDLGSMGDERRFVYQGQEIKICCKPCEAKFLKNPQKYLAKLK
jgi:hypothetical protein